MSLRVWKQLLGVCMVLGLLMPGSGYAAESSLPVLPQKVEAEIEVASKAVNAALVKGPSDITILDQARLKLPAGYGFIPPKEARQLLHALGNQPDDITQGMIVPLTDKSGWFIVMRYENEGYIKDDDAKNWNADELLQNTREGTEAQNAERRSRGFPEMEIIGWMEKPHYDAAMHRLVWAVSSKQKGVIDTTPGVNYKTLLLGREGFISMNLVADAKEIESLKPTAKTLLAALSFNEGKRYADFNASTDKIAEYGLGALIAGVAAKKLGLVAVIAAFIAKFAKVIILGCVALVGIGKRLWPLRKNKPVSLVKNDKTL